MSKKPHNFRIEGDIFACAHLNSFSLYASNNGYFQKKLNGLKKISSPAQNFYKDIEQFDEYRAYCLEIQKELQKEENCDPKFFIPIENLTEKEIVENYGPPLGREDGWLILIGSGMNKGKYLHRVKKFEPKTLEVNLKKFIDSLEGTQALDSQLLKNNLKELLGDPLVNHCEFIEFTKEGELIIKASSVSWQTQLKYLQKIIIDNANKILKSNKVSSLKILGPNTRTFKRGKYSVRGGRGPRDTWG